MQWIVWIAVVASVSLPGGSSLAGTGEDRAPNAMFREGARAPTGWRLSGGQGRWVEKSRLEVTGTGNDSNHWRAELGEIEPGSLFRFDMRARRLSGRGTVVGGPAYANRDFRDVGGEWKWYGFVSRAPDDAEGRYLRLGQWHSTGAVQFDEAHFRPAIALHRIVGGFRLGEGESFHGGHYAFHGTFRGPGSNAHRPLWRARAGFNSDRWVFGDRSEVVYRFGFPGRRFRSARAGVSIRYWVKGRAILEASTDGGEWRELAAREALGDVSAPVPESLLPAERLWVRVCAGGGGDVFQVHALEFEGELDGDLPDGDGETVFATVEGVSGGVEIVEGALAGAAGRGTMGVTLALRNGTGQPATARIEGEVRDGRGETRRIDPVRSRLAPGTPTRVRIELPPRSPGQSEVSLSIAGPTGGAQRLRFDLRTPDYYRADYGERLANAESGDAAALWWCDATRKVSPGRLVPQAVGSAVRISAAKGDREAAQVVVRAKREIRRLTARVTALEREGGGSIAPERVRVLRVHYHEVTHPTDATGVRGRWPDALPPLREPVTVPEGENRPLWILVSVPPDAAAGDYRGSVELEAEGWRASVPLRLHVWDFALPRRNHIETAFGFSPSLAFRYHGATSEADRRRVLDLYFRSFSEHRISPYDPAPLDPIRVRFPADDQPPRVSVDFTAFDVAMERAVREYGFTGIRLSIQGMGGGTFHHRYPPKIGHHEEGSERYKALFSSYAGQLEAHLREKGWLDLAYVYWFDEPAPRDYDFVRAGMARLHRYAPGLRRMLTEEPGGELAGSVDLWCPVSYNYDHEAAQRRRAEGEHFWWYVCTGPKAPYCTLFIDHPATELRIWLWQTWQRGIDGILVWSSNYWTSSAAFPDEPQNPYDDPMGYVSGYSTPRGVKRYWGNGDGRFVYPPERAAVPGKSGTGPVFDPPVSSIRWEMLREGIEDWEFLYRLRELLGEKSDRLSAAARARYRSLLEVPPEITVDRTAFTTDSAAIYRRRAEVAEAIEVLSRL